MKINLISVIVLISIAFLNISCSNKPKNAIELVNKSVAFHDPNNQWNNLDVLFEFKSSFSWNDSIPEQLLLGIDVPNYSLDYLNTDRKLHYIFTQDSCSTLLGSPSCSDFIWAYNFYIYMWGLPMKLNDPNTKIKQDFTMESINNKEAYAIEVNYENEDWRFFFDQNTYQLLGFTFIKKDGSNHGEKVIVSDLFEYNGIKFPKIRTFYKLDNNKYIGENEVVKITER